MLKKRINIFLFLLYFFCLVFGQILAAEKIQVDEEIGNQFKTGEFYYSQKKYALAINYFKKFIEHNPDIAIAHFYLGNIYNHLKDFPSAENYYQKALSLEAKNVEFLINYANLKYRQSQFNKSKDIYKQALKIDSTRYTIFSDLAMIYFRQFEYELAADSFEKCIQTYPLHPQRSLMEQWVLKLRQKAPDAKAFREKLIQLGRPLDSKIYGFNFSLDLKNAIQELEADSKNAEAISDTDLDFEIVD